MDVHGTEAAFVDGAVSRVSRRVMRLQSKSVVTQTNTKKKPGAVAATAGVDPAPASVPAPATFAVVTDESSTRR